MAVHGAAAGDVVVRDRPRALHRPRPHACATRRRCATAARCPAARARCSIRRRDPPARRRSSPTRRRAIDIVTGVAETRDACAGAGREVPATATSPTACSSWRGRTARSCCASSTPPRPTRSSTAASPSSRPLRQRRAARRRRACSRATAAGSRACGATRSPATCRSCCCRSATPRNIDLVRQLVQAHAYWRLKGLAVDLVIWNEDRSATARCCRTQIMGLIAARRRGARDRPAGRHLRAPRRADRRTRTASCCRSVARVILIDSRGTLAEQIDRRGRAPKCRRPRLAAARARAEPTPSRGAELAARDLIARSTASAASRRDGREYVITTDAGHATPAPWVNVLANPRFGTVVSESGSAYTWCENAHEFRLTPWHNDPVSDAERRSVLPARRGDRPVLVADAAAGARRDAVRRPATASATASSSTPRTASPPSCAVYVAIDAPVKFSCSSCATARAGRGGSRSTGYCRVVLGRPAAENAPCTSSPRSTRRAARCSRATPTTREFADRVAFFDCSETDAHRHRRPHRVPRPQRHACAARRRMRARGSPAGSAPASIPCAAMQVDVRARRRPGARDRLHARRRPRPADDARTLVAALPRHRRRARSALEGVWALLEPHARRGARRDARPRRSTSWPTAGCSTRRSPAACGRAAASTSRAARSASATSCRTRWRWSTPSRARCASSCCAARRASSARATCSTGGIRRRAAACARISPTTTSGCRYATCRYVAAHRRHRRARRDGAASSRAGR